MSKNVNNEKPKKGIISKGNRIVRRLRLKNFWGKNQSEEQERQLNKMIISIVEKYINNIKENGLKNELIKRAPGLDIDNIVISKMREKLSNARNIELGFGIGRVSAQYRNEELVINPSGTIGWFLREIVITNGQISSAIEDIINQFQIKYIDNSSYITSKMSEILDVLSETGIYKPSTSEEKTLYDLLLLVLLTYNTDENDIPPWIETAIDNLEQVNVIEHLVSLLIEHIASIAGNISQNLYVNFKLTLDSWLLRIALNKKTNYGQISGLLELLNVDIKSLINGFVEDYMSPSFITGMGQLVSEIASSFLYDSKDVIDELDDDERQGLPFQVTITLGEGPQTQRAFRWYTDDFIRGGCIEYSKTKDFKESITKDAEYLRVIKPVTILNLGLVSTYSTNHVSKYSVVLSGLEEGTKYWYRVGNKENGLWSEPTYFKIPKVDNSFMFINLADSQGMVKYDYEVFTKTFEAVAEKFPNASFVSHLGDFVDDGNNEDYWNWLLNNQIWGNQTVVPVAGNHEAKINSTIKKSGVENSIISHFNLKNIPPQDTSTGVYYSYVFRNATFIVLNTNNTNKENKISDEQYNWALGVAKNANTKWKIILMHKSPYSNGPHHSDDDVKGISVQINKFVKECDIDMVIAGHDHVYVRTPILSNMSRVSCRTKLVKHNGIKYETVVNPYGTLFVIPGTSGVKNYKQDLSVILPSEVVAQPDCPVYSIVSIDDKRIYFTAYKYDIDENISTLLDSYAIEKSDERVPDFDRVSDMISSLSKDISDLEEDSIDEALRLYNSLSTKDKGKVKNYSKLLSAKEVLKDYNEINSKSFVVVGSKDEFINALKDSTVGTIITNGTTIKFETVFGRDNKYIIDRNICIRGSSILKNVSFNVTNGAAMILDDSISIDATRKQGSLYKSMNIIELNDYTTLIINGKVTIRTEYGIGAGGYCIYAQGKNVSMYLNSSSEQWGSSGAVYSPNKGSRIIINSGIYANKRNKYAVYANGLVVINGGKLKSLKTIKFSELYINEGIIGYKDVNYANSPLNVSGEAYVTGAKLRGCNKETIKLTGKATRFYIQSDHNGSVNIAGDTPYIGRAETADYSEVLFRIPCNNSNYLYTMQRPVPSFADLTKSKSMRLYSRGPKYMSAILPKGNNYVYAKSLYASSGLTKDYIDCDKGSQVYVYSKVRNIQNNPIQRVELAHHNIRLSLYDDLCNKTRIRLHYDSYPLDAFNDALYWETSDDNVVKVDQIGRLYVIKKGTAKITISLVKNPKIQDSCNIIVE